MLCDHLLQQTSVRHNLPSCTKTWNAYPVVLVGSRIKYQLASHDKLTPRIASITHVFHNQIEIITITLKLTSENAHS